LPTVSTQQQSNVIKNQSNKSDDNINRNRQLIILGNGPSIKDAYPRLLELKKTTTNDFFLVNLAPIDKLFFELKPKYYCMVDLVAQNKKNVIYARAKNCFDIINKKVDWKMNFYTHSANAPLKYLYPKLFSTNPCVEYNFFDAKWYEGTEEQRFEAYKNGLAWVQARNILNHAIFIGINLGHSKILLYGADYSLFNIHIDKNNIVYSKCAYFYDNPAAITFKPEFNGWTGEPLRMSGLLESHADIFKCHDILAEYAKWMGIKIINCTKDSLIDSYERER
jgi:hypothetical protein